MATGWFGWTPDVALAMDVLAIEAARRGRLNMFRTLFGGSSKPASDGPLGGDGKPIQFTPQVFDVMFGNARRPSDGNRRRR